MAETLTIRTSSSTDVIKVVERGPQGPTGPQGPAGEGGASTWNDITGKPATFPPSAHDHQPGEVYADAAFVSQTGGSGRGGIYLRNGSDNGKPLYESPATGDYIWWDSNIDTWYLTSRPGVNLFEITNNTDDFPWETDALWQPIAPQTGNVEVDQASLFDVSDYSSTSVVGLKTPKSGNASSDELVLGSDTRLTNSRTPTAHASTHHTGGSDPITPANIGAAPAVNVIELTPSPGFTTITTSQLPARGIAYIEGGGSFTVNLPTPDKRQSGLTFSIKVEHEGASGDVFITVVHNASDLLTGYELDEDESSLDFLWDGYRWTYSSANWLYSYPNRRLVIPPLSGTLGLSEPADNVFRIVGSSDATKKVAFEVDGISAGTTRTLTVPDASGTIARTEDFASPPAIGNTTPAAGSFTTLNATGTTELVNGGTAAGPFRVYNTSSAANANYERGFMRWSSNVFQIGTEKDGTGSARALALQVDGTTRLSIATNGSVALAGSPVAFYYPGGVWAGVGGAFAVAGVLSLNNTLNAIITADAANIIAIRNGATGQTFRVYNKDGANFERGKFAWDSDILRIGTEKGGTGTARALEFQTDSVTRLTLGDAGGVTIADANDIAVGTTTGTKIGTSTTQKIGFFNATPVVQQAAIADATDAATTQARLNDLLATMRTFGLIAT